MKILRATFKLCPFMVSTSTEEETPDQPALRAPRVQRAKQVPREKKVIREFPGRRGCPGCRACRDQRDLRAWRVPREKREKREKREIQASAVQRA